MAVIVGGTRCDRSAEPATARGVFRRNSPVSAIDFDTSGATPVCVEAWSFGSVSMIRTAVSEIRLARSPRDISHGPTGRLGLAVQERGIGRFEQFGFAHVVFPGELLLADLDAPYTFRWSGGGSSRCVRIPVAALEIPRAELARAARALHASPLYDLARGHIARLNIARAGEVSRAAGEALGTATIALADALLCPARRTGRG
ncbi:hypothetical protein [Nocardia harenae]|uniref:AraC-like ligand-binding domain-containing protein n=1 Tax=Nocardia harenae TaxID=358707 RepID=UPI0008334414|nr:hypothetical protein [Nocardia harenae]